MDEKAVAERVALGFLSFGGLSLFYSTSPVSILASAVAGAMLHLAYFFLRPLPWGRYFKNSTSACVSVTRDLYFREVSLKAPDKLGFVRVQNLGKKELFTRLQGKKLNPDTIPFHWRVAIEERRSLDLPWEVVEPHLKVI